MNRRDYLAAEFAYLCGYDLGEDVSEVDIAADLLSLGIHVFHEPPRHNHHVEHTKGIAPTTVELGKEALPTLSR
jgi:hypothetical protein